MPTGYFWESYFENHWLTAKSHLGATLALEEQEQEVALPTSSLEAGGAGGREGPIHRGSGSLSISAAPWASQESIPHELGQPDRYGGREAQAAAVWR
jgi:hypothetical protein